MADKKVTEAQIIKESDNNVAKAEAGRRALGEKFRKEEKVPVSISPLYKPYFGKVRTVSINGISCAIPVDGKTYKVPKSFADEVNIRKFRQDELMEKAKNMSDVQNNFESSPGELALF